jgi:Flp pilus assembly pilin Flp
VQEIWPGPDEQAGDERSRGASLVEYALLIALIALVAFVAVDFLGSQTGDSLEHSTSSMFG